MLPDTPGPRYGGLSTTTDDYHGHAPVRRLLRRHLRPHRRLPRPLHLPSCLGRRPGRGRQGRRLGQARTAEFADRAPAVLIRCPVAEKAACPRRTAAEAAAADMNYALVDVHAAVWLHRLDELRAAGLAPVANIGNDKTAPTARPTPLRAWPLRAFSTSWPGRRAAGSPSSTWDQSASWPNPSPRPTPSSRSTNSRLPRASRRRARCPAGRRPAVAQGAPPRWPASSRSKPPTITPRQGRRPARFQAAYCPRRPATRTRSASRSSRFWLDRLAADGAKLDTASRRSSTRSPRG